MDDDNPASSVLFNWLNLKQSKQKQKKLSDNKFIALVFVLLLCPLCFTGAKQSFSSSRKSSKMEKKKKDKKRSESTATRTSFRW